jgi:hypothetical protein
LAKRRHLHVVIVISRIVRWNRRELLPLTHGVLLSYCGYSPPSNLSESQSGQIFVLFLAFPDFHLPDFAMSAEYQPKEADGSTLTPTIGQIMLAAQTTSTGNVIHTERLHGESKWH